MDAQRIAALLRELADELEGTTAPKPETVPPDDLLTIPEAAALLRLSPKSTYKLVDEGKLDVVRLSTRRLRIRRPSLVAFITRQETTPRRKLR